MPNLVARLKRLLLEQRISMLRADMACAAERRESAVRTVASVNQWEAEAHMRLRSMRQELLLLESPQALLSEALQERSARHG
jgi:hypothetical protein